MVKKESRIGYIALIQIIATALIVLSHSVANTVAYPAITGTVVGVLQKAGLTSFMWCSGYLLVKADSIQKYGYTGYLKRRFIRLMVPFFVVQLLMFLPKYLIGVATDQVINFSIQSIIHSFLFPREGILPHLWFLPTLMILCIVSPGLLKLSQSRTGWIITMVVGAIMVYLPLETNILCVSDVKNYLFWYVMGLGCAMHLDMDSIKNIPKVWVSATVAIAAMLLVCFYVFSGSLYEIVPGFLALFLMVVISINCVRRGVFHISKYTFPVYILSLPVQNIIEILVGRMGLGWLPATIAMFLAGIMVPLILAACVGRIDKKRKTKIVSRCIGL